MPKSLKNILKTQTHTQSFVVIAALAMTIFNVIVLSQDIRRIQGFKQHLSHQIIGYQFKGLDQFIKGVPAMGYYTDGDLESKDPQKMFSQAQYLLAPTILDPDSLEYEYILMVCDDEKKAWLKAKELRAVPLRRNNHGMILARRKI